MAETKRVSVVLFLEDDKTTVEVLHDLLEMHFGEQVVILSANTVAEAKHLFRFNFTLIRVVMVDQNLRTDHSSGAEFVRWIREDRRFRGALVAFSGSSDAVDDLVAAGCNISLPKPIRPDEFIGMVERSNSA